MGAHGRGRPTRRGLQEIRYMGVRQGARVGGVSLNPARGKYLHGGVPGSTTVTEVGMDSGEKEKEPGSHPIKGRRQGSSCLRRAGLAHNKPGSSDCYSGLDASLRNWRSCRLCQLSTALASLLPSSAASLASSMNGPTRAVGVPGSDLTSPWTTAFLALRQSSTLVASSNPSISSLSRITSFQL